ncbi:bifunctional metallophosphatase/5'-nucleotidase [Nocardioides sp. Leaf374]|uniref:bifunctional metallophosphatase/5'-nucleotidase n=1 Tax=Nocardioides sp. Leaf374 TaxID=2876560 RepID=UPI00226C4C24|nr:5'-nucleotidase C-terminal domain-containing protein [Nocardioides sp. Leaf374]
MLSRSWSGRATRPLAASLGLGVAAAALSVTTAAPAQAVPSAPAPRADKVVDLTLLNINDFHGRIDANTTKFATTIEGLKAANGPKRTLFLSAGDNIGASLFASSQFKDRPTLKVLDALGLKTSSVGNHEFDRGFDDLDGRVDDVADFSYLGANVYAEGTRTPVLPAYDTFRRAGVTVGVIGAVTEETASLVSPAGIEGIEFGDPVVAVNRVARQLSDGRPGNGEADVLVAEFHEGAGEGAPAGATLEEEVAAGGAFARIVTRTTPKVDAIFTGHTHKQYAWDAPVPGTERTRPVLQTGSYGENIGRITLSVNQRTGRVKAYTQENVARVAEADLSYPAVVKVQQITNRALRLAAEIGNQPVAEITDDITTAFAGGSYGPDGYTGGTRDARAEESALGDLVANALRDGVQDFAEPDLGLTNPGGLRAELLFAGDTTSNPANTDGVVTFAEANAVLPFNNTVAIVKLTGADLKQVLEQQYQTNADGSVPSRPYLQLGMSDNVQVTTDPTAPAGSRITSVLIDGEPLDPARTYTISTLSFLATGGDNFRAFTNGTFTDTGLLDAELWRDYLAGNDPVSPDFARQQVTESGLPDALVAGEEASFTLSKLNLTSLGSPANTELTATYVDGSTTSPLGTFPITTVDGGSATVTLTVPAGSSGGVVELVAAPSGTTVTVPVSGTR